MSIDYFNKIGFEFPKQSNPADYIMKILNPESLAIELLEKSIELDIEHNQLEIFEKHSQRLKMLVENFQSLKLNHKNNFFNEIQQDSNQDNTSFFIQLKWIMKRSFQDEIRNPLNLLLRLISSGFFALIILLIFHNVIFFIKKKKNQNIIY